MEINIIVQKKKKIGLSHSIHYSYHIHLYLDICITL
jgi:hypothetical protein